MHTGRPLLNDDVLRQILHHELLGLPDLASSAQVCKAFSEPALDALSRRIYFHHLLKILDPSLQRACNQGHPSLTQTWKPSAGQWDRFQSYARRGRDVIIEEDDLNDVPPEVLSAVIQHSRKHPLFPYLLSLRWVYSEKLACADLVVNLITQAAGSLQSVDLMTSETSQFLMDYSTAFPSFQLLLQTLAREVPSLQYLQLSPAMPSMLSLLAPFRHLKTLLISVVTVSDIVRFCAHMPCLTELTMRCVNTGEGIPRCVRFPVLRKLTVRDDCHVMAVTELCRSISSPDMTSIIFEALVTDTWDEVHDLLDTIQSSFGTSLRVLELRCGVFCSLMMRSVAIDAIAPLLHLYRLEHVKLCIESQFLTDLAFTDDVLCAMASAWPNLVHLSLSSRVPSALSLYTTLTSFAQHCPALTYLSLRISLHDRPAHGDVVTEGEGEGEGEVEDVRPSCAPHRLVELYWETLNVSDARRLARFLDGTFPQVDLYWMSQEGYSELWSALVEVRVGRERHAQHVVVS